MKTQQELIELLKSDYEPRIIAPNSRFFLQIMEDGNVFNPYLHRRFLPVRFYKMWLNALNNKSFLDSAIRRYTDRYCKKTFIEEVKKLVYLEDHDKMAFDERSLCLTMDDAKEYLRLLLTGYFYVQDDFKKIQNYKDIVWFWDRYNLKANNGDSSQAKKYYLQHIFLKAGAYYTLKTQIMFETNNIVLGENKIEQCNFILQKLKENNNWEYFTSFLK